MAADEARDAHNEAGNRRGGTSVGHPSAEAASIAPDTRPTGRWRDGFYEVVDDDGRIVATNRPRTPPPHDARKTYEAGLRNAWRQQVLPMVEVAEAMATLEPTDDGLALFAASMALHERRDVGPLVGILRSERPLSREARDSIAGLLELLHARGKPRRRGRPNTKKAGAWKNNAQVAAYLAKLLQDSWRGKHRRKNAPDAVTRECVAAAIRTIEEGSGGKKSADTEKVIAILKGGKLLLP